MGRRLYVGNLPYSVTEEGLTDKFSQFGQVESTKLIIDRDTGRSKGFGFVEMSTDAEAQAQQTLIMARGKADATFIQVTPRDCLR